MANREISRRDMLRLTGGVAACLLGVGNAAAEGAANLDDPKLRFVDLPALLLPGKQRFGFIRLSMRLVVRKSEHLPAENALVTAYKPRIIGMLTEELPSDEHLSRSSDPSDLANVKDKVRALTNGIVGQPVIEDVLIVSFLAS